MRLSDFEKWATGIGITLFACFLTYSLSGAIKQQELREKYAHEEKMEWLKSQKIERNHE